MKQLIKLRLNGEDVEVAVLPHRTLLEVLREDLDLTGTKHGCEMGNCGACTVLLDGRPVMSCLVLAVEAEGCEITTIEGLARDGQLHPVQYGFAEHGGAQCGYCTPGMIMSAVALLERNPRPSRAEIRAALSGNLCRCTGYVKILDAVERAAELAAGRAAIPADELLGPPVLAASGREGAREH